jgi:hypothetical protein
MSIREHDQHRYDAQEKHDDDVDDGNGSGEEGVDIMTGWADVTRLVVSIIIPHHTALPPNCVIENVA